MDKDRIIQIMARKFSGQAQNDELMELRKWIDDSEENRQLFKSLESYWYSHLTGRNNSKEVLDRIRYRIKTDASESAANAETISPWYSRNWLKLAAAMVLIAVVSFLFVSQYGEEQPIAKAATAIEKLNPPGQKSTFVLSDGTLVKLNAESRLTYPDKFDAESREVHLEGEAFFEVKHNPEKPFIVRSGDVSTTVLGTSFSVTAYAEEDMLSVALLTGKVSVENHRENVLEDREVTISPGQMVVYSKSHSKVEILDEIPEDVMSWSKNILMFRDKELVEMIKRLERWYGVSFSVENSGKIKRKFSGKFEDRSLEYVLDVLSYNGAFEYEIEEKNVTIVGK